MADFIKDYIHHDVGIDEETTLLGRVLGIAVTVVIFSLLGIAFIA